MIKYITILSIGLLALLNAAIASPEANFNKLVKEFTLNPDGSMEFHYYKELKINSHVALNNLYGETFIIYNPQYQSIKFNQAYTKQADGTIIKMPANAFNEVLPADAADAPAYNHLKEMVVTHTGLEVGATIFLDYTLFSKAGYLKELDIDEVIQEQSPVKEYKLIINVPVNKVLHYSLTGTNSKPNVTANGIMKQYAWNLSNIREVSRETFQPMNKNNVPRLTATTYVSQTNALKTLNNNIKTIVNENGIKFTIDLIKAEKNDLDRVLKIQEYIVNQIATCPLSMENTAYQMRAPYDVLVSAYGTIPEKVRVMIAMLKAININTKIVVTYPKTLDKNIKGLKPLQDMKVKVNIEGKPLFLAVNSCPSKSIALRGNRDEAWVMAEDTILPLLIRPNKEEIIHHTGMKIEKNKAISTGNVSFSENLMPQTNSKNLEKYIKNIISLGRNIYKTQMMPADGKVVMNFTAEQKLYPENGYLTFTLPNDKEGVEGWRMNILGSSRNSEFEIPYPVKENYTYDIEISPELALKTKAREINIKNPVGYVKISIKANGQVLKVQQELELNKAIITPSEYNDFRELMLAWTNPANQTLLFSVEK